MVVSLCAFLAARNAPAPAERFSAAGRLVLAACVLWVLVAAAVVPAARGAIADEPFMARGFYTSLKPDYLKHTYFWYNLVLKSSPEHRPRVEPAAATKMAEALVKAGYKAEYQVLAQALQTGQSGVALQAVRSGVVPKGKDLLWTAFFRQPYDRDNHFPDPSPEIIAELLKHNDPNVGPIRHTTSIAPHVPAVTS